MRAKKEYQINSTLSMRLTEKAGVTEEIMDFLNDQDSGKVSQEVFKAIKYWIRTQGANDRLRKTIEEEAMKMESKLARYGENRGPYRRHDESEDEVLKLKEEISRLRAESNDNYQPSKLEPKKEQVNNRPSEEMSLYTESEMPSYEDELYGTPIREENSSPMAKALKSIPKLG